jgi:hypothetical protein
MGKLGYEVKIPTDVLYHIKSVGIPISEQELMNFVQNLSTGSGIGHYYYNVCDTPHPKLVKYLQNEYPSFYKILIEALAYATQSHNKYLGILASTGNLEKVDLERKKFITSLAVWESVSCSDEFELDIFQSALIMVGNVNEAAINCGLEHSDLIDLKSNQRVARLFATYTQI